jgi:hypothetical protein
MELGALETELFDRALDLATARFPFQGSTLAKPMNLSGNSATIPAISSLVRGGSPVAVSASQARSTPTMSSFS